MSSDSGRNLLRLFRTSSDRIIRDKKKSPTWVNTNVFPSLYPDQIFLSLMEMYKWTNVYVILDESSNLFYSFVARVTQEPFQKRRIQTTKLVYSSQPQGLDYDRVLKDFSQNNRGMEQN